MWFLAFLVILFSLVSAKEVPFTLEDRERIIRLEEGQKALMQKIEDTNKRIDDVREEIRDLKNFMLWGFGVLFAGMMTLIGFVIWDRRTALSPAIRRTEALKEAGLL
ncbi:MAG: hypothetical protein D6804_05520 [Aquificota bacterium]|jgi:uncharacterized protein YdhG (YjbR/CyaY superfamily)|nr:MAG: hypothetical protein D6804_05520 [Aquificota bacterium]